MEYLFGVLFFVVTVLIVLWGMVHFSKNSDDESDEL